jgi:hypothetical protein
MNLVLSTGVLMIWTIAVMVVGWLVFRQRELALYSGK